jgi:phosphate transport system permease protein
MSHKMRAMNEMPVPRNLPMPTSASSRLNGSRLHAWRIFKDRFARASITVGGMSVLVAILLIFFYLLYELIPLFRPAVAEEVANYPLSTVTSDTDAPLYLTTEEQAEVGMRLSSSGELVFFSVTSGQLVRRLPLPLPEGVAITSFALESEQSQLMAVGLSNGGALLFKPDYVVTYPDDKRLITPELRLPSGEVPLQLGSGAVGPMALRDSSSALIVAGVIDGQLKALKYEKKTDFLSGESTLSEVPLVLPMVDIRPSHVLISPDQRVLYALSRNGDYRVIDLLRSEQVDSGRLFDRGKITDVRFLLGGLSILVSDDNGNVGQWSLVRKPDVNPQLVRIRVLHTGSTDSAVQLLAPEHRRKNFLSVDTRGELRIVNTTGERVSLNVDIGAQAVRNISFAPRGNALIFETADQRIHFWHVENEHSEVSLKSLWAKVWYEGYPEPDYIWQSSSASTEFEPKYSLTPLAFGTLKAAFYAMLLGAPLAICGAIFTAYFMSPALRTKIKPLIELMEALPTVILGFLAGLWLAPFVEKHLPGVFAVLILMPAGVLIFAFAWNQVPVSVRKYIPEGWQPVLLVPVVALIAWLCFSLSGNVEHAFFGGDMRAWITNELGITYDQRNALVVGIAMGFAVIPNIFSIAEDAIFSVPKHLSFGSLALGATPWQTLVGVVLPTASPGIFSALMIGMGRAVGETMIVLMATGNTPVMEANIFEGMRTLAANIAVEIGETEVGSTHYRVLFLAAFVLFMFTFVVNTVAEVVRQRLRKRYTVL